MTDSPWIKFYPADWLIGTRGMSAAEIGVYITLIATMYERGGSVPLDPVRLGRDCGVPAATFSKLLDRLVGLGKIENDGVSLTNQRAQNELSSRADARLRASKAAGERWEKSKQNQHNEDASQMHKPYIRAGARYQNTDSKRNLPSEGKEKPLASEQPSDARKGTSLPRGWVLPRSWGEWALREFPQLSAVEVRQVADEFRDYWIGVPGAKGRKLDWEATWRNRIRAYIARRPRAGPAALPRKSNLQRLTEEFQQELANDGHGDQSQEGRNPHDDERLSLIAGSRDG